MGDEGEVGQVSRSLIIKDLEFHVTGSASPRDPSRKCQETCSEHCCQVPEPQTPSWSSRIGFQLQKDSRTRQSRYNLGTGYKRAEMIMWGPIWGTKKKPGTLIFPRHALEVALEWSFRA